MYLTGLLREGPCAPHQLPGSKSQPRGAILNLFRFYPETGHGTTLNARGIIQPPGRRCRPKSRVLGAQVGSHKAGSHRRGNSYSPRERIAMLIMPCASSGGSPTSYAPLPGGRRGGSQSHQQRIVIDVLAKANHRGKE